MLAAVAVMPPLVTPMMMCVMPMVPAVMTVMGSGMA